MLSWRKADATHTMPSTRRASSNSSTTASYTRAITPWTNETDPQVPTQMHQFTWFWSLVSSEGMLILVPFWTLQIPLTP